MSADVNPTRTSAARQWYRRAPVNRWATVPVAMREGARARLKKALTHVGSTGRAFEVGRCGDAAIATTDTGEIVVSARTGVPAALVNECGHRLCPDCARRVACRNARKIRKRVLAVQQEGAHDVRFATLTQPARPDEKPGEALDRLGDALRRLTRSKAWKTEVAGAVIKVEIERSTRATREARAQALDDEAVRLRSKGQTTAAERRETQARDIRARGSASWWHAHAHLLLVGSYWHQADLLREWRASLDRTGRYARERARMAAGTLKAFGGARIEAPRGNDQERAIQEVAKYTTKPMATIGKLDDDELVDLLQALKGRRVIRCTGLLYGLKLEEDRAPAEVSEGCDDECELIGPKERDAHMGVTLEGVPVRRSEVVWRTDTETRELRRVILELHEMHRLGARECDFPPPSYNSS